MHVIIEHSQMRKRMHVVLPGTKAITRLTVTNHCKRIDTYLFTILKNIMPSDALIFFKQKIHVHTLLLIFHEGKY